MRDETTAQRALAQSKADTLTGVFRQFHERWPDPNRGIGVESYPQYAEIYERIIKHGLFERRERFKRAFTEWSGNDLLNLNAAFDVAIRDIEERLDPVNDILDRLPFGAGQDRLRITVRRLHPELLTAFRKELRYLGSNVTEDLTHEQVEERFTRLRAFMGRLREPGVANQAEVRASLPGRGIREGRWRARPPCGERVAAARFPAHPGGAARQGHSAGAAHEPSACGHQASGRILVHHSAGGARAAAAEGGGLKQPGDVLADIQRRLDRTWHESIAGDESSWPHAFPLGTPVGEELQRTFTAVQQEVFSWRDWSAARSVSLRFATRRVAGTDQTLPTHLLVPNVQTAAQLCGREWTDRLARGEARLARVRDDFPHAGTAKLIRQLDAYAEVDFRPAVDRRALVPRAHRHRADAATGADRGAALEVAEYQTTAGAHTRRRGDARTR
jgi:hypothetical protein